MREISTAQGPSPVYVWLATPSESLECNGNIAHAMRRYAGGWNMCAKQTCQSMMLVMTRIWRPSASSWPLIGLTLPQTSLHQRRPNPFQNDRYCCSNASWIADVQHVHLKARSAVCQAQGMQPADGQLEPANGVPMHVAECPRPSLEPHHPSPHSPRAGPLSEGPPDLHAC